MLLQPARASDQVPFFDFSSTEVSMLATQKRTTDTQALLQRLAQARSNTDKLFQIVRTESLYERPISERHRIIFYIGHLEAFDWNLFRQQKPSLSSFAPELDQLFAFGIDPLGGGLPTDLPEAWPSVARVKEYNRRIRGTLDAALESDEFAGETSVGQVSSHTLLNVAIEHRLMHSETLTYMFHQMPLEQKIWRSQNSSVGKSYQTDMVRIPAGRTTLGLERNEASSFGWDNEFEAVEIEVPAFQIDKYMVTNAEFLEFVLAGGYDKSDLWSPEDWRWKQAHNIHHPAFWRAPQDEWFYRGMFEEVLLPLDWPVYVSHAEAAAFARWANKSLPTEAEWHRAAYGTPEGRERAYPCGEEIPLNGKGNFDFWRWDPTHVNAFPENRSAFGVVGQLGNGWEWTSSVFAPFAGFQPFAFYPGYSANFFDGQHYVIKGGSARTAACMLRRSFRNWFQPHYQYVYAGFRCVSR
jgi:gamma-glutamyl hercynylcysteine S-oxide synthase